MFESLGVINVWTYLVGLFFIIIAPGPNSLYVLRTGVVRGIGPGYKAALGVFVGDAILIFCAYLGIASLIRTTPLLFTLVRYLGALYLLYLGVKILHANFVARKAGQASVMDPGERYFTKALTLSLTNPKAIFFFLSVFPQFIEPGQAYWPQFLLLVLSYSALVVLIHCAYALGAQGARRWLASERGGRLVNRAAALTFMGFGAALALARR